MTVYAFRLGVFDEMIPFDVFSAAVVHVFVRCWTVWSMYVLLLVNRTRPCCDDEAYFIKSFTFSGISEALPLTRCLLHRRIMYTMMTCNRETERKSPNPAQSVSCAEAYLSACFPLINQVLGRCPISERDTGSRNSRCQS
jgi:hypothetical protein